MNKVAAYPHSFPLQGGLDPENSALMVIDMQIDFCAAGGYMEQMGVDIAPLRAPIEPIQKLLQAMRPLGYTIVHTRETFSSDMSDVQPHRRFRGPQGDGIVIGDMGPMGRTLVRGEPCWEIIPELAPLEDEAVFDKAAYGAFGSTDIDAYLKEKGIEHLVLTGVTSNCCIQSNLREGLDRGYECIVLEDCCASSSPEAHAQSMALIRNAHAVFGCLSTSGELLKTLASR